MLSQPSISSYRHHRLIRSFLLRGIVERSSGSCRLSTSYTVLSLERIKLRDWHPLGAPFPRGYPLQVILTSPHLFIHPERI